MADVGKSGDAERQREIELADGTRVSVPYREAAQAQDDASRTFRDSGMGRSPLPCFQAGSGSVDSVIAHSPSLMSEG
jgi:hypothetical protein